MKGAELPTEVAQGSLSVSVVVVGSPSLHHTTRLYPRLTFLFMPSGKREFLMISKTAIERVAARYYWRKYAGPLTDVSHLRYQAVFLMGAGGSGKGYASHQWLKYMPGGGMSGAARKEWSEKTKEKMTEEERSLSNLTFENVVKGLEAQGIRVELVEGGTSAKIPFRLYTYDDKGREQLLDPKKWDRELPPEVRDRVVTMAGRLTEIVFKAPVHELPSYWRQVNPDIYKEEIAGYLESQPGYVHEMSSEMSKAYFEAAIETGDPLFMDGTGANAKKLLGQFKKVKERGYKVALVLVFVPLTVNHIRNATRARKVSPRVVSLMWKKITANFSQLRGVADKAKVVINRNDQADARRWAKHHEEIDAFIRKGYGGQYSGLKELIQAESPSEMAEWTKHLRW